MAFICGIVEAIQSPLLSLSFAMAAGATPISLLVDDDCAAAFSPACCLLISPIDCASSS